MTDVAGYSLVGYGNMITDRPRMKAYANALRKAVRLGCVVVDIGAGTGIFSLLACQFGASHVHAVEPHDAIQVARDLALRNKCADRISFHQKVSADVTLPALADVIISDLRGVLPLFQKHIPSVVDARQRLLAPGGVLIPRRDTLWAAVIENSTFYRPYAEPWVSNDYGLDLSAGHLLVVNTWKKVNAKAQQLLVSPQRWAVVDYATIESPNVRGELDFTVERSGVAHGVILWFDTELIEGIGFSNAPGQPELIYGQAFFPLQAPVALSPGDHISVDLRADLVGDEYVWCWNATVLDGSGTKSVKARFQQSTALGVPLTLEKLRRREAGFIPKPSDTVTITQYILAAIDGNTSLGEIAKRLMSRFPSKFSRWEDALTAVADVTAKYSR